MTLPLTDHRMEALRTRLLEEKHELERRTRDNDHYGLANSYRDETGDLSAIDNHPADAGTEMYERGKDLALLEREAFRLERIDAALARMKTGEYGRCAACGSFIPPERLEAMPTAIYCVAHEPMQEETRSRPIEEEFLNPPFGRTSLDERDDQNGFDGEDAWQIVESWGNSNTPAMAEGNNNDDYGNLSIEADENEGFVEPIESFLATDITGHDISVVRNRAYHRYMAQAEGDPLLEPDEWAEE
ncbi:TraR/DksA C4-type zinc finger protein [Cohnella nanjingensis]|uniref:TraR/DksA C4-type zinc finger protein n=1 Tax=Cohnella nanjingensis TaxID=1387779 RepID=A0A7X0RVM2_9BACL|nr:TraR/DksA C4-type zinc finger protein [Cohnella nanjingensis]MBB6673200.1 TraR/DksA C4-type zinc finger protein [Cohnella nanjingensis]